MSRNCRATRRMALWECTGGLGKYRMMPVKAWRTQVMKAGWRRKNCRKWTRKVIGRVRSQVLEDAEARHVFIKRTKWRSTESRGHVVVGTAGRGANAVAHVCEHCKLFPNGGCPPIMGIDERRTTCAVGGAEVAGHRMTGGSRTSASLCRLATQQMNKRLSQQTEHQMEN